MRTETHTNTLTKESLHELLITQNKTPWEHINRIVVGWSQADDFVESIVGPHRLTKEKRLEELYSPFPIYHPVLNEFEDETLEKNIL